MTFASRAEIMIAAESAAAFLDQLNQLSHQAAAFDNSGASSVATALDDVLVRLLLGQEQEYATAVVVLGECNLQDHAHTIDKSAQNLADIGAATFFVNIGVDDNDPPPVNGVVDYWLPSVAMPSKTVQFLADSLVCGMQSGMESGWDAPDGSGTEDAPLMPSWNPSPLVQWACTSPTSLILFLVDTSSTINDSSLDLAINLILDYASNAAPDLHMDYGVVQVAEGAEIILPWQRQGETHLGNATRLRHKLAALTSSISGPSDLSAAIRLVQQQSLDDLNAFAATQPMLLVFLTDGKSLNQADLETVTALRSDSATFVPVALTNDDVTAVRDLAEPYRDVPVLANFIPIAAAEFAMYLVSEFGTCHRYSYDSGMSEGNLDTNPRQSNFSAPGAPEAQPSQVGTGLSPEKCDAVVPVAFQITYLLATTHLLQLQPQLLLTVMFQDRPRCWAVTSNETQFVMRWAEPAFEYHMKAALQLTPTEYDLSGSYAASQPDIANLLAVMTLTELLAVDDIILIRQGPEGTGTAITLLESQVTWKPTLYPASSTPAATRRSVPAGAVAAMVALAVILVAAVMVSIMLQGRHSAKITAPNTLLSEQPIAGREIDEAPVTTVLLQSPSLSAPSMPVERPRPARIVAWDSLSMAGSVNRGTIV